MPDRKINPEYIKAYQNLLKTTPYFDLLGMNLVDLEPGRSVFSIPVEHKLMNTLDWVHGGVLASVVDAASYYALFSLPESRHPLTTIELKINYLGLTRKGVGLTAIGQAIKLGKKVGLAEARVLEAETGKLICHGTSTCLVLPHEWPEKMNDLPPKFLDD